MTRDTAGEIAGQSRLLQECVEASSVSGSEFSPRARLLFINPV